MLATTLFPIGAVLISVLSFFYPQLLLPLKNAIVPLLGVVMLGMGMTLRPENFIEVCRRPKAIVTGIILQYLLMPMIAYLIANLFYLDKGLFIGMVLLGSCPGGTASNVICYLARGDVALSITLTTVSTVLAVFLTPVMTWLYIGQRVPVPVLDMTFDIFLIILVPVTTGVLVNHYLGRYIHFIKHVFPYISVLAIILIIGVIVTLNHDNIPVVAIPLLAAIFWHNLLGLSGGYFLSRFLGLEERVCRTIAIEVGMQNSGLAVALAQTYFTALSALPGAIFSIWHNITGSVLAWYWGKKTERTPASKFTHT